MPRYFIQLSYKGTAYHGWQIQENAHSIQAELNSALSTYFREDIHTLGAGRTDAGVHAKFYVAHFDCSNELLEQDEQAHLYKLNCMLPADIALYKLKRMADDAHARFDATSRSYQYYISRKKNPFWNSYAYSLYVPLNVEEMNKAAGLLLASSDFTSFSKLHSDVTNNYCDVTHAKWQEEEGSLLVFSITANRFLRDMVRAIVGSLLEVGKERITVDDFQNIIDAKSRQKAGVSVPAKGLYLTNVSYPYDIG